MKPSVRRLAWGVAVVLVLVLGAAIALKVMLSPERLRAEVQRRTADATGLPVELDSAALSFVPFGVQLRGLHVGEPGQPFLELGAGLVQLELGPLLSRRIVVSRITLDAPRVALVQGPDGLLLPGRLGDPPRESPGEPAGGAARAGAAGAGAFATTVERIEIREGHLTLRTPDGAGDLSLDGIGLDARLEILAGGEEIRTAGELQLAGLTLAALEAWRETLDRLQPVVAFDLEARPGQGELRIHELRLRADPLDVAGSGVIEGLPDAARIRLEVAPRTYELSELLPLIPAAMIPEGRTPTARGPVRLAATVEGPLGGDEPPAWRAEIGFEGAELAMTGFPVGIGDLRGQVRADASALQFDELTAKLCDDPLSVSGRVDDLDTEAPRVDLTVRGDLDLGLLERGGFTPEGVSLGGRANLDVRAVGRADQPEAAALTGTARLASGRVTTPELPVPLTDLTLEARLAGADVELSAVRGRLGRSSFEGQGRVTNALGDPRIRLDGRCPVLDLVELAPPAGGDGPNRAPGSGAGGSAGSPETPPLVPPLPPFPAVVSLAVDSLFTAGMVLSAVTLEADLRPAEGKVTAQVGHAQAETISLERFDTRIDLRDGRASGDFRAPRVQAHVVPLTNVTGQFDLTPDRQLRVADVRGSVWTGSVAGDATIDLTNPADPGFTIRSRADGIQANDFLSALTPARNVLFGTLDIESSFSGRGATAAEIVGALTGEGAVATANGRLESTPAIQQTWATLGLDDRKEIPFADLVAPFSLRAGRLHTDSLAIGGRDAEWRVNGSVGLDGGLDYRVTAELSELVSDQVRQRAGRDLANLLAGSSGRLIVDLHIHGDARSPKVDLDRRKLAARVAENVKRQLQEELEKSKSDAADKLGDALKGFFNKK